MAPIILVLVLLMPAAMATTTTPPKCLNATLPNILDLGKCLGSSLNLCTATVEDIVAAVVNLVQCLIAALLKLDALSALAALIDIIDLVLSLLGLDGLKLTGLIKPLCCVSNVPGCKKIFTGTETCKAPIVVSLPGNLNLGECLTDTLLLCNEGGPCTDVLRPPLWTRVALFNTLKDDVLARLVKALACLLKTLLGTNPGSLLFGLACVVAGLLETVAATVTIVIKILCLAVVASIRLVVTCG